MNIIHVYIHIYEQDSGSDGGESPSDADEDSDRPLPRPLAGGNKRQRAGDSRADSDVGAAGSSVPVAGGQDASLEQVEAAALALLKRRRL